MKTYKSCGACGEDYIPHSHTDKGYCTECDSEIFFGEIPLDTVYIPRNEECYKCRELPQHSASRVRSDHRIEDTVRFLEETGRNAPDFPKLRNF